MSTPLEKAIRLRVKAIDGTPAFGPGKADLLEGIARSGSISAAARDMGMSYRRAWDLVQVMNRLFAHPLVEGGAGGKGGGGAHLTESGQQVLAAYRAAEAAAAEAARPHVAQINAQLKQPVDLASSPG